MAHTIHLVPLLILSPSFVGLVATTSTRHFGLRGEYASNTTCIDGCARRTLFGIIWACVLTTVICAWSTVHPNIPPRRSGWLKRTLRRTSLMLCVIIAPEILPAWALKQMRAAWAIKNLYNNRGGAEEQAVPGSIFSRLIKIVVQELPAELLDRGERGDWTLRHGHFLIMGGFRLVEPPLAKNRGPIELSDERADIEQGNPVLSDTERGLPMTMLVSRNTNDHSPSDPDVEQGNPISNTERGLPITTTGANDDSSSDPDGVILTLEMLRELLKDKELDFKLNVTDDEIKDKSKGDALSATIFVCQTTWFFQVCILRSTNGLGVTPLELSTAALASLNLTTQLLWWKKPLGVEVPMYVSLSRRLTPAERNAGRDPGTEARLRKFYEKIKQKPSRTRDQPELRNSFASAIVNLICSPFIMALCLFLDVLYTSSISADATHVPMFYAPDHTLESRFQSPHTGVLLMLTCLFGALHIVGYPFTTLPTDIERKLWFDVSMAITLTPLALQLAFALIAGVLYIIYKPTKAAKLRGPSNWIPDNVRIPLGWLARSSQAISTVIYVGGRIILIGLAVTAMRRQPDSVFRVVDWTKVNWKQFLGWNNYFPHLSS